MAVEGSNCRASRIEQVEKTIRVNSIFIFLRYSICIIMIIEVMLRKAIALYRFCAIIFKRTKYTAHGQAEEEGVDCQRLTAG
tara:strand:- start:310 stop:555 length:246 start_codon:yes stop_codon:yes gene_type:complete